MRICIYVSVPKMSLSQSYQKGKVMKHSEILKCCWMDGSSLFIHRDSFQAGALIIYNVIVKNSWQVPFVCRQAEV